MKRLLVCLLLSLFVVGCGASDGDKAVAEFNKGVDFSARKDWATAIACFDKAIQLDPDYTNAYIYRGAAYQWLGNDV
jgi:Tfp pilus assembly protein PilF